MELPYAGDVQELNKDTFPLDDFFDDNEITDAAAVDTLIDSLMLPSDCCTPGDMPNPLTRSWYQTLMKRIVDPSCEPVLWRQDQDQDQELDLISTPPQIVSDAETALTQFRRAFCLKDMVKLGKEEKEKNKREKGKREVLNFEDHL
jgi:hypothetical protein